MKKKTRRRWKGTIKWNEPTCRDGGRGHNLTAMLKADGLKASKDHSPYVGHVGIWIEIENKKEAEQAAETITGKRADASWLLNDAIA